MRRFALSLVLMLVLAACLPVPPVPQTPSDSTTAAPVVTIDQPQPVPLRVGHGVQDGWYAVYFTDPADPNSAQENGGLDEVLADAIDQAKISVDMAIYSISLHAVRDALIRAYQRGVIVRMVMETDSMDRTVPRSLIDAGIPILGDRQDGLMHDKFIVIDRSEVWTGSLNYTVNGVYEDNNNLIRIRSVKVAEDYSQEFNEMFIDDQFGPNTVADTPNPRVTVDGTAIEVYFSPDDGVAQRVVEILSDAQESIEFMAYSFTSDDISFAMQERSQTGVAVSGVFDNSQVQSNIGTDFDALAQAGLDVRLDGNPGLMHHKVIIVDDYVVITGSYNFTNSAETRNDENLVIIYNPTIAQQYLAEFKRVYSQAQLPGEDQ